MNPTHAIRRAAGIMTWLAGALLASVGAAPAALATPSPRPPGWNKHPPLPAGLLPAVRFPPGWNKHPPLPPHLHPLATGGISGWQLTLMTAAQECFQRIGERDGLDAVASLSRRPGAGGRVKRMQSPRS